MNLIEKLRIEKAKARFKRKSNRVECDNCKFRMGYEITGDKEPYCSPNTFLLLGVPCKTRYENHYEQCLWLNGKISFEEMLGKK